MTTYDEVNSSWGGVKLPPITAKKAAPIFVKLVRKFGGRKMRTPGWSRRTQRSWAAPKGSDTAVPHVNGVPRLVHDASHWVFGQLHPGFKTHSAVHAAFEKQMIETVLSNGWHLPRAPKPKPTADERRAVELARVEASVKRWETKARRAATALRKLRAKQKRLHAATR